MSRLPLPDADTLPADALAQLAGGEALMGFTPNDARAMARKPALLAAMSRLVGAVYGPGELDPGLKRLIGYVSSTAAGCRYCQQHTAHGAAGQGVDAEKVAAAWAYETSPLFTDAERAALRIAHLGSFSPSEVTDEDFAELRRHYSDEACTEVVAVISLFGFLNRWNAVLDTDIETVPAEHATRAGLEVR